MKKPVVKKEAILEAVNLPKMISGHLFGERHTEKHRMYVGVLVIFAGVAISKFPLGGFIVHYLCDAVGYGVHGVGLIPFVDALTRKKQS